MNKTQLCTWVAIILVIIGTCGVCFGVDMENTREQWSVQGMMDFPSVQWGRLMYLSELRSLLNMTSWDVSDAELQSRVKKFMMSHHEALEAYKALHGRSENKRQRHLLQEAIHDDSIDAWMFTWIESLSTLVGQIAAGNDVEDGDLLTELEGAFAQDWDESLSLSHIQQLMQTIFTELTFKQTGLKAPEDTDIWTRLQRSIQDVQDLQRRVGLARGLLAAFQGYETCRSGVQDSSTLDCFKELVHDLEELVADFEVHQYSLDHPERGEGGLLESFRNDMSKSMASYQTCRKMTDWKRIPCTAEWWKHVVEMQQKYAKLDASVLAPPDARLVTLLKQMLSLESYIPGTDPTVSLDHHPSSLSELIEHALRSDEGEEDQKRPIKALKRVVASLKEFVGRMGVFSRLGRGQEDDAASGNSRRLLWSNEQSSVLGRYQIDLQQLSQSLSAILERRTQLGEKFDKTQLVKALEFLIQSGRVLSESQSWSEGSSFKSHLKERILEAIRNRIAGDTDSISRKIKQEIMNRIEERISRSSRSLLMDVEQQELFSIYAPDRNGTGDDQMSYAQRMFKEKAARSLEDLGELKSLATRKLAQVDDDDSGKMFIQAIQPVLHELLDILENHDGSAIPEELRDVLDRFEKLLAEYESLNPSVKAAVDLVRRAVVRLMAEDFSEIKSGMDLEEEKSKLDALLHRSMAAGWRRVMEDADEELQRILKACTSIVAHDAHYKASTDHGIPMEHLMVEDLPAGSTEILSQVGKATKALSKLHESLPQNSRQLKHKDTERNPDGRSNQRMLLQSYPQLGQSIDSFSGETVDQDTLQEFDSFDVLDEGDFYIMSADIVNEPSLVGVKGIANDYALTVLNPFVPELMDVDVEAIDDPRWWRGKTLSVPEDHHFQYAFDFGSYDEGAPDHEGLGTLMKYYLLKDIRNAETMADKRRNLLVEYIFFFLGLWLGLFLAIVTIGTCLLKQTLAGDQTSAAESYLDDSEMAREPLLYKLRARQLPPIQKPGLTVRTGTLS